MEVRRVLKLLVLSIGTRSRRRELARDFVVEEAIRVIAADKYEIKLFSRGDDRRYIKPSWP